MLAKNIHKSMRKLLCSLIRIGLCLFVLTCIIYAGKVNAAGASEPKVAASIVRFDSKGQKLAIAKDDRSIAVYDKSSKEILWTLPPSELPICSIFFRADDSQLVTVNSAACSPEPYPMEASIGGGNIKIYDSRSGRLLKAFEPNFLRTCDDQKERIHTVELGPSGNVLALEGFNFKIITFLNLDVAIKRTKGGELRLADWIRTVSSSSQVHLSVKSEKTSMAFMGEISFYTEEKDWLTDLKFCPDGKHIAATTRSGRLLVWKFLPTDYTNGHLSKVSDVESYSRQVGDNPEYRDLFGLDCSEKHILTVGYFSIHGQMQLWDIETGKMLHYSDQVDPSTANKVKFDKSGRFAVTIGDLRYVLWEIKDNKLHALCKMYFGKFPHPYANGWPSYLNSVDFSPTENIVALGVASTVDIVDISSLTTVEIIGQKDERLEIIPLTGNN